MKYFFALQVVTLLFSMPIQASDLSDTNSPEKGQYNLFNPTPRGLMRPINSGAADGVRDAHTLDAGHFEVDADIVNYYYYSDHLSYPAVPLQDHFSEDQYAWIPRFRMGVLNNVELEIAPSYARYSGYDSVTLGFTSFSGAAHSSQFGPINLGPVISLYGNDNGAIALAIHPFLSIPTERGNVLGGVEIPLGVELQHGFYLKFDTEFYAADNFQPIDHLGYNFSHANYWGFYNAFSVHKAVCPKAEAYCYISSTVTTDSSRYYSPSSYGYTGLGLIYKISPDLELYGGIGFGLSSMVYDYNPRFGLAFRF
jgi:outer membrane putative beta-barrel porin/alpha-amylase